MGGLVGRQDLGSTSINMICRRGHLGVDIDLLIDLVFLRRTALIAHILLRRVNSSVLVGVVCGHARARHG